MSAILFTEEAWRNSHLSVARHYGGITINNTRYIIVNKEGKDLFECTRDADQAGRKFAIEPGEPVDLIDENYKLIYRKVGRDKFIQMVNAGFNFKQMQDEILKNS